MGFLKEHFHSFIDIFQKSSVDLDVRKVSEFTINLVISSIVFSDISKSEKLLALHWCIIMFYTGQGVVILSVMHAQFNQWVTDKFEGWFNACGVKLSAIVLAEITQEIKLSNTKIIKKYRNCTKVINVFDEMNSASDLGSKKVFWRERINTESNSWHYLKENEIKIMAI